MRNSQGLIDLVHEWFDSASRGDADIVEQRMRWPRHMHSFRYRGIRGGERRLGRETTDANDARRSHCFAAVVSSLPQGGRRPEVRSDSRLDPGPQRSDRLGLRMTAHRRGPPVRTSSMGNHVGPNRTLSTTAMESEASIG